MTVVFSDKFIKSAKLLPSKLQIKLNKLVGILERDPFHPFLHTKQLCGELTGFWSFRVTRDWRVLFQFHDSYVIQLLRVAHRKDVYR